MKQPMYCPRCGEELVIGRWVDATKFLDFLEPYIHRPGRGNWKDGGYRVNDTYLPPRHKDREVLATVERGLRRNIHAAVAERILSHVGLDPHIPDDMLV